MRKLSPITLVELLMEEYLKPLSIGQYRLAKELSRRCMNTLTACHILQASG